MTSQSLGAERARALMVLGTGSHVGKSLLTTALCRIFKQDGLRVAPFKAQNMALNSAATPEGLEIGRAQALQAEAAGVLPSADMNPLLLKPCSDTGSQVVLQGRVWGQVNAWDYHQHRTEQWFPKVLESYARLASAHDLIVLEGAGSPAEVNLKEHDIVNLRMARAARAACLLVGDIDRGGVFASLVGTLELLEPAERELIRGFAVNKFRGDRALLDPGIEFLEQRLERPCLGVVPYLRDVGLEEEDGVALDRRRTVARCWPEENGANRRLRVGVVALPHLANFTDFDALAAEPSVALAFVDRPEQVARADLLVLPGSKRTLDDLDWLHTEGFASAVYAHAAQRPLLGVCGGMQMLGLELHDAEGLEGGGRVPGLGLLPVRTALGGHKVTRRSRVVKAHTPVFGSDVGKTLPVGYEIHLGRTSYDDGARPLFRLRREGDMNDVEDGAVSSDGRVLGTYLHGLFDEDAFRHAFVAALRKHLDLSSATTWSAFTAERQQRLDRLAAHVRGALNMDILRGWLGLDLSSATANGAPLAAGRSRA